MAFLSRFKRTETASSAQPHYGASLGRNGDSLENEMEKGDYDDSPVQFLTWRSVVLGLLVSMGGFIFGYDTGQISGFLEMPDFLRRFGTNGEFSDVRAGLITGLLSIGTLIGAIFSAPIADRIGRKWSIAFWSIIFCVGVIVQIATQNAWYQVAIGRLVAGFGVGALSVLVPMYQSESAPRQVRGALVSAYQLFITFGIFIAYCINYGTEAMENASSWQIVMGVGFIWAFILGFGILLLPESPRYAYRKGRVEEAKNTMTKNYGVPHNHRAVAEEIQEIKDKLAAEHSGGPQPWYAVFTGPRMAYRTLLGVALQALQQLTGANFFFYYGNTIFQATGLTNSYVTQMILGGVNFGMTFPGLYVVEHFGRRRALITGGLWCFMCFLVFASVGHFSLDQTTPQNTPKAGAAMIVFACLFIAGYAMTWGPIVWAIIGELYPSRYRAKAMALATSSNWILNFYISFCTPFITSAIDYRYGYVFAACNFLGAAVVYFFLLESQGRTLEEIDTMYILRIKPWESSKWVPPPRDQLVTAERVNQDGSAGMS
ncbi:MAG: hypothetical protein M1812_006962 [Candelaria pacifica]|nr:MAG: hypothetical protein M1812_006962 [Candelaria pacifica]